MHHGYRKLFTSCLSSSCRESAPPKRNPRPGAALSSRHARRRQQGSAPRRTRIGCTATISRRAGASASSRYPGNARKRSSRNGRMRSRPADQSRRRSTSATSKRCPRCGSSDVRRSSFQGTDERKPYALRSPYRCEECGERFWVISRKARHAMIWILVLVVLMIASSIALLILAEIPQQGPSAPPSDGAIVLPDVRRVALGA